MVHSAAGPACSAHVILSGPVAGKGELSRFHVSLILCLQQGTSDAEKSSTGDAGASQHGSGENGQPHVSPPGQGGNGSCDTEEFRAMRKKFFQLLYGHIVHKSDVTAFEDTCRSMLGANSYVLFTIQKLVLKLARHLASVIAVCFPRQHR